jgi:adenylate cyclase
MSVLKELIEHRERVVTKEELLDRVWGDRFVTESALTTQIKQLRRAVGDTGRRQAIVRTVHGQGYLFVAPVERGVGHPASATDRDSPTAVVAVLPISEVPGDPSSADLADALTADIIRDLSGDASLQVLGRAIASGYRETADPASALREDFGVDQVVAGTIRLHESRVRVTVRLTDSMSGVCRWAERHERELEDSVDVLGEITDEIVANVARHVRRAATVCRSRRIPTSSPRLGAVTS